MLRWLSILAVLLGIASTAHPCSICCPPGAGVKPLRKDLAQAALVVYGTLANPRLDNNDLSGGKTDLIIEKVLKAHPLLGNRKVLELPRFVPVDPKNPTKLIAFFATYKDRSNIDRLEFLPSLEVQSPRLLKYIQELLDLDPKDSTKALLYFFERLDDPDALVAADAYVEFALAGDREVAAVAGKLSAEKLRRWIKDPKTPALRLGLYAFLLAAGGAEEDAALLRSLIVNLRPENNNGLQGFLAGYIQLRPREGWDLACSLVKDENRPFMDRYAILRTARFYHVWKPEEARKQVLRVLKIALQEGDLADVPIEDLRQWKVWDLTGDVLALYGKKSHDAPILRRTIVRYALCCPDPAAARFVARVEQKDPETVKDVRQSLRNE